MKKTFISLFLMMFFAFQANATDLQGFGIIREFGGTDNAAMFGLLAPAGTNLQISNITGPAGYKGTFTLDQTAMTNMFAQSSNPMSQQERSDIISQYNGAQVIYFEGYNATLCTYNEIEYNIEVSGTLDGSPFSATFQFIALPSSNGDCGYHEFTTMIQN